MARQVINEALISQVEGYVVGGLYVKTACELAGIGRSTFYDWKKRGKAGEKPYADFFERISTAEAKAEARLSTHVEKAAASEWRAAAWKLERRFPERYAEHKVNRVMLQAEVESVLDQVAEHMSDAAFAELLEAIAKVNGVE